MKPSYVATALGLLLLFLDQGSKYLTQKFLPLMSGPYPYKGIPVFKNFGGIEFSIVHATNRGAAWGMFADYQEWLIGLRILLVIALLPTSFSTTRRPPIPFL